MWDLFIYLFLLREYKHGTRHVEISTERAERKIQFPQEPGVKETCYITEG